MRKLTLLLLILAFQAQSQWYYCSNPWLANYKYRKVITIKQTNISSALTSFPVYVKCDNTIMGALVDQTNFYDIRFTDTLNNVLNFQADSVSSSVGNYWINTSLSAIASHPTRIYCYYKNSTSQINGSNTANTWDANYVSVYHLGQPSLSYLNDSKGSNNLTNNDGATGVVGKIGRAESFTSSSTQSLSISNPANFPTGTAVRTIEGWVKMGANQEETIFGYGANNGVGCRFNIYNYPQSTWLLTEIENAGGRFTFTYTTNWYHIVSVFPANSTKDDSIKMYYNGVLQTNTNTGTALNTVKTEFKIGGLATYTSGLYFTGYVDEVRISNIARSADWIKFEYYNMNDSDQDLTWSAVQTR